MEHRDILKDQIEQIGKVLAGLISHLLKSNSTNSNDSISFIKKQLQSQFNITMDQWLNFSPKEVKQQLIDNKFNEYHIDQLSGLFENIYKLNKDKSYLETSILILKINNELAETFSIKRNNKIAELKNIVLSNS